MGICDEFISEEKLEQIKIDFGPGLSEEEWRRIQAKRDSDNHLDFIKISDFKVRCKDFKWIIY